jgi:transcriptional regulator with XRE-family HTH domain
VTETGKELREFLASRRAALEPEDVGLPVSLSARRVRGLRREEVAILAGVSVDYYTKLEQGRAANISEQVLVAIEGALRLDELERRHLRSLIRPTSVYTARTPIESGLKARPAALTMIHAMAVPAVIHGPRLEVLGINAMGKALLDDFDVMPVAERNMARWMFLNPRAKIVYLNWDAIAPQMVAILRAAAIPGLRDDRLEKLIGELTVSSSDFARFWADYRLFEHSHGVKHFYNETVGEMKINYETLAMPGERGQTVVVYSADKGSPSEEKLQLLASWSAAGKAGPVGEVAGRPERP